MGSRQGRRLIIEHQSPIGFVVVRIQGVTTRSGTSEVNPHSGESVVVSGRTAETFEYGSGFCQLAVSFQEVIRSVWTVNAVSPNLSGSVVSTDDFGGMAVEIAPIGSGVWIGHRGRRS